MDPRQPQHPFSRNTASPYGRTPFPPSSNQPFPSTHPPSAAPSYAPEHQRRPSDPSYFSQPQRSYAQEGHQIPGQGHSRHQSASSVGTPINRNMPPPSSPQQQGPPPQQPSHHGGYGPPPPRAPPVSVGPPSTFPSGRELPTLPPLGRPASNGSSMSISSMLGGPPPASREPPPSQYASPMVTSAPAPTSMFGSTHASPRISTTAADYPTYRRPQTPEHQRNFEPRDHRANSAGSPPVMGQYATPEGRRYGTPQQGYGQRMPGVDERREPMRVPNPNAMPPRPSSQPSAFNAPPPTRATESSRPPTHNEAMFARRMDGAPRAPEPPSRTEPSYGRPPFEERHDTYTYAERDRQEREAAMIREAESQAIRLQRENQARAAEHGNSTYAQQLAQRNAQNTYSRPSEPRDQTPAWMRPGYEQADRRYEPAPNERAPPQQPATTGYEYPATTTAPQFGRVGAYNHSSMPPVEHRYSQPSQPPPSSMAPQQHSLQQSAHYEREAIERQRIAQQQEEQRLRQQQQQALDQQRQQQQQSMYGNHQNQQYQQHESPQRRPQPEESQPMQPSRSFLGVQEINRKGRASPLPQAVQGAQGPLNVAGGEPSIKNEFGRMFSGIGISLGAMSVPSPVSASAQGMPFSNSGQLRREDLESLQDSPVENGHRLPRSASRQGGGRRRKLKEEDSRDDESSTGRRTPSGNGRGGAKRAKTGHHHAPHHHHHHRPDENISSPSQSNLTPFKSAKASAIPSPPGPEPRSTPSLHHHHVPRHHHHHHHVTPAKAAAPANVVVPLIKAIVKNQEVINAVASIPRRNLGSDYYRSELRPGGQPTIHPKLAAGKKFKPNAGFVSTPQPLPRFEGRENCLYTIKIPPIYLTHSSREEITKRKAVWGTDIYTDDSDVIAACIHQGWFRGAWDRSVDVNLLDLEIDVGSNGEVQKPFSIEDTMTRPPPTGPIEVPEDRECHVELIIMPTLQNYSSLVRFGIKSREWGFKREGYQSVHDGMSFMIHTVKWVAVVDGQEGRTRATRSKIFAMQLDNKELEEESAWDAMLMNGNGSSSKSNGYVQDSFERGASRPGDIQDTRPWITGVNRSSPKGKEKEAAPSPTPPPARILGPLPPPIPSPLSSPLVAPEPLDEEEVTPNMAALLATSLEAERVPMRPVEQIREQRMVKPTPQQETQIERVTERMIENANMMGTEHSLVRAFSPAPALDPIATLADLAVATSQAAVVPVPLSAPIVSPIVSPLTAPIPALAVPEAGLKTEIAKEDINSRVKPPQISGQVPSIFG